MSIKSPQFSLEIWLVFIFLSSCNVPKTPDFKTPDYKIPEVKVPGLSGYDDILKTLFTCNKSDQELNLDSPRNEADIIVQDTIENKEIIEVNCDQVKTSTGIGPVRYFDQVIDLQPPADLSEVINYVVIENPRTCSEQRLNTVKLNSDKNDPIIMSQLNQSFLSETGVVKIAVSDFNIKLSQMFLNVKDGKNVISVKYYGKCNQYSDIKNVKSGDAYNCLYANLLATKSFLLTVEINRPTVDGSQEKSICYKK